MRSVSTPNDQQSWIGCGLCGREICVPLNDVCATETDEKHCKKSHQNEAASDAGPTPCSYALGFANRKTATNQASQSGDKETRLQNLIMGGSQFSSSVEPAENSVDRQESKRDDEASYQPLAGSLGVRFRGIAHSVMLQKSFRSNTPNCSLRDLTLKFAGNGVLGNLEEMISLVNAIVMTNNDPPVPCQFMSS